MIQIHLYFCFSHCNVQKIFARLVCCDYPWQRFYLEYIQHVYKLLCHLLVKMVLIFLQCLEFHVLKYPMTHLYIFLNSRLFLVYISIKLIDK
jgi:hypothetical protein